MISIGIGEIQKNTSILSKISEVIEIVDKRQNKKIAVVYPVKQSSVIDILAGKYKNRVCKIDDIDKAKEDLMIVAMKAKYDIS
ncbi:hypothetical protein [Arcobacter sp. FWKO B]|uniref:hypothetical protein n=1 Tax=Arcobacter sp. FWKO B TaxID=2593672 RepID=UPI0018A4A093|nr:hypothetical protein [Arcobacter sp. FWKO B]QOG11602.1 hypothetical protein FWKOB_02310 [Arcobacter sp. FWKO B]